MTTKFNRGSEWRKWDLHVHTPLSIVNNYGGNTDAIWDKYIDALEKLPKEVSVLGITDYYFIEGYEKVMQYKSNGRLSNIDKIFPILEFRIDTFGSGNENKLQKINLHILFNLDEKDIENEIQRVKKEFISVIHITKLEKHKTKILSKDNFINESGDLQSGFDSLIPSTDEVLNIVNSTTWRERTFLFLGYKEWSNLEKNQQLKPFKADLYDKVGAFFSSNYTTISKSQEWLNEFGCKRLLHSGDIHDFAKLTNQYICNTWIKADPTFEGLKQIINEPERVFIGDKPDLLKREEISPTKFIKNICIQKTVAFPIDEEWYGSNTSIDFNPGLVAIIGNKGSGKSAITDIISVCANTRINDFSFLSSKKFRHPKPYDRSKAFEAKITWGDDTTTSFVSLDKNGDVNQPERVKYIPQNYLETLCTIEDDNKFESEIKSIIFQHLSEEEKYEKDSLDGIIDYLSFEIKNAEKDLIVEIQNQNEIIISLEEKQLPEYVAKLKSEYELKRQEYENLQKIKPAEVTKPNHADNEEELKKQKEIEEYNKQKVEILKQISEKEERLGLVKKQIVDLKNAKERLARISFTVQSTINDLTTLFSNSGLSIDNIINFTVNIQIIDEKIKCLEEEENTITGALSNDINDSLADKLKKINSAINDINNKLSEPDRNYQQYQENLKEWQSKVDAVDGNVTMKDTIKYYEAQLKYLSTDLESDLNTAVEKRKESIDKLLRKKREELNKRAILYKPVSDFISQYSDVLRDYPINIDSVFVFDGIERLFDIVSHQSSGTFYGKDNGMLKLKEMKSEVDLSDNDAIYSFALSLNDALNKDLKDGEKKEIKNQLRKDHSLKELYDFIYGFEYIKPLFELKLDGKKLSTLSPGERGALLLLFYLFIDMDDRPLIIDQPEENLDNESVYKYLVKFIKMAKDKRQVIMVTHNPNLAVVCDAEQIIKMEIDKKNKNKVSFISGSIENPNINKAIVDVLEGTYPAFHNRDQKYLDKKI